MTKMRQKRDINEGLDHYDRRKTNDSFNERRSIMKRLSIITACLALCSLSGQRTLAQNGQDLFQKALVAERSQGDLNEAIRLYQQIVAGHKEDRALVAKALMQMGNCYEKLGRSEAQKMYNRIVNEYGDQPEIVAQARSRLAALTPTGNMQQVGLMTRELMIPYSRGISLDRNGSKLLYTAMRNTRENVVIHDIDTGEETQITHYASGDKGGLWPIFAPDGRQIAYMDIDCNLHVVSLQTHEDRQLDQKGSPIDWSSDGRLILLGWTPSRGIMTCSVLSIDNATVKKLNLELPYAKQDCRFSPDAHYISYSRDGNLYLYHIEKDEIIQLTRGTNQDTQPIWSSDGRTLLFLSRRAFGPEPDLCMALVVDGKIAGDVQVIVPDMGNDITLRSLSQRGRLLYEQDHVDKYVCSMTVDPGTGDPVGDLTRIVRGSHPVWSPDGKQIAYVNDSVLHVMSADGHNDREVISVGFHRSGTYAWGPDNDTVYMPEIIKGNISISAITLSSKERRTIWPGDGKTDALHVTCSPDGKRLAFLKPVGPQGKYQIFTIDMDGTKLRQLTFNVEHNAFYPAWSPDGKEIAFMSHSGDVSTLAAVSVEEGKVREVFRGNTPQDRFWFKSWSPDGSKIVWMAQDGIRIGDVATGRYHTLNINEVQPILPCWSPDGTKILFNTTEVSKVMILENFLPRSDEPK